uniref:Uncharacterized protein n=1 Tax=Lepeophtheirus salmonis TaxID=72036 RepID=A0A0K2VLD6_LEPSM
MLGLNHHAMHPLHSVLPGLHAVANNLPRPNASSPHGQHPNSVNSANGGNASSSGSHHGSSHHHHLSLSNSSSSHGSQHHGNNSGNAGGSVNCMSHSNSPNTGSPPNGLPGLPGSAPINMWPLIWNHITKGRRRKKKKQNIAILPSLFPFHTLVE